MLNLAFVGLGTYQLDAGEAQDDSLDVITIDVVSTTVTAHLFSTDGSVPTGNDEFETIVLQSVGDKGDGGGDGGGGGDGSGGGLVISSTAYGVRIPKEITEAVLLFRFLLLGFPKFREKLKAKSSKPILRLHGFRD